MPAQDDYQDEPNPVMGSVDTSQNQQYGSYDANQGSNLRQRPPSSSKPSKPTFKPRKLDVSYTKPDPESVKQSVSKKKMSAMAAGPTYSKNIRKHDVSNIKRRKSSDDSYGSDGYGDGFDSDTEIKPKPIMKPNPKLASNPFSFKANQGVSSSHVSQQPSYQDDPGGFAKKKKLIINSV